MPSFDLTPQEVQVIAALRACATAHFDLMLAGETPPSPIAKPSPATKPSPIAKPSPPSKTRRAVAKLPQAPPPAAPAGGHVPACPNCGGEMWDNRETKKNRRAPDFKCKNKTCLDDNGFTTGVYQSALKSPPQRAQNSFNRTSPGAGRPASRAPMQLLTERCTEAGLCCDRDGLAVVPHILNVLKFEKFTSGVVDSDSITPDNWQPAFACIQRHYQQSS